MNLIQRDDTVHNVYYVTLDEAQEVIWRLGEERDEAIRRGNRWRECARMFWIATAPNGGCINIPVLKKALAEYDRLKEEAP